MTDDSESADRRGFLRAAGLATVAAALAGGTARGQAPTSPPPQAPPSAAPPPQQGPRLLQMPGKARLVVLQDRPLVAQTPESMLDDDTTPTDKFFISNHGVMPDIRGERDAW